MEQALDRRLAKALSGECAYSGCHEVAADGEHCARHAEHERKRGAERQARRRERLVAGKRCLDCGKPVKSRGLRRCAACRKTQVERTHRVTGVLNRVTGECADPGSTRVARTKIERAYAKLADGTERFIERVVFRSRGAQSKESQDVDGTADVEEAVRLLAGHAERLRELRAVEGSLGRIARDEARAAVADRLLRATRLLAGEAARITPEGWKVVRDGLARIGERDDDE